MISWAVTFFIIAMVTALLGFTGLAGAASNIAWFLTVVGAAFAIFFLIRGRRPKLQKS